MLIGVFVLMLLGGLLLAMGPIKDKKEKAEPPVALEPTPATGAPMPQQNDALPLPQTANPASEVSAETSVPLTADNLAFDVNADRKLNVNDIAIVANIIDSHQYAALYDFNSDNVVDVNDLAEIRSVYQGYPLAEFDVTLDDVLDVQDVVTTANIIDAHHYAALYDYNSDYVVDTKDLAMVRTAVALAGTVKTAPGR